MVNQVLRCLNRDVSKGLLERELLSILIYSFPMCIAESQGSQTPFSEEKLLTFNSYVILILVNIFQIEINIDERALYETAFDKL